MVVEAEPGDDAQATLTWTRTKRLREPNGRFLARGALPIGRWVQIESLLVADWQADTTRFLVDFAEYDALNRRWTLRPPQAPDPFDLGTEQG
jgi:chorismate-pyruvate lyase